MEREREEKDKRYKLRDSRKETTVSKITRKNRIYFCYLLPPPGVTPLSAE